MSYWLTKNLFSTTAIEILVIRDLFQHVGCHFSQFFRLNEFVCVCVCICNTWSVGPLSGWEWLISPQLCCLSVSCCAFDPFHTVIMLNSGNVPTLFSWNTSLSVPAGTRWQRWLNSVVFSKIKENFVAIYGDKTSVLEKVYTETLLRIQLSPAWISVLHQLHEITLISQTVATI